MTHYMKLKRVPFDKIKNGTKTVEMRLYDEKRQLLEVGDIIEFSCVDNDEKLVCKVISLNKFNSFEELYATVPLERCGYSADEILTASANDMLEYYSLEKQRQYGVLAIGLKLNS